jgi:hypothetical protein
MKKIVLVPQDLVHPARPVDETLDNLDAQMSKILKSYNIPTDVKVKQYNQVLQRYMFLKNERNKPIELEIAGYASGPTIHEQVLKGLPDSKQNLGRLLLDFITRQSNIAIENNGELSINGSQIPNSNIIDLVHDLVRDRKNRPPPTGSEALMKTLKQANMPIEYIGNKDRIGKLIRQQPVTSPPVPVAGHLERLPGWVELNV